MHNGARPARKNLFPAATVAGLLTVYLIFLLLGAFHDSVTVDEFALVPSGYAKLLYPGKANWLNTTNPPLIQVMLAFPLLFLHCQLPESWIAKEFPELRWEIGYRFMHANRDKYVNAFFLARLVSIALAVLLAFFVYRWSRELFGVGGGIVSLALICFCPNLIAHGHLANVDIGFTTFLFLSSYYFWRFLRGALDNFRILGLFVASFCAAALSRFTILLLLPVYGSLLFVQAPKTKASSSRTRFGVFLLLIVGSTALLSINTLYRWEGVGRPLATFGFESDTFRTLQTSALGVLPSPLPKWYLRGMDYEEVWVETKRSLFFFLGRVSDRKHPAYFLFAFLVKTPIPTLLLLVVALVLHLRMWRMEFLHLLLPAAWLLGFFSLVIGLNLGLRYVLPIYPFLFTASGIIGQAIEGRRRWQRAAAAVLLGSLCSTLLSAPRFLSYFNAFVGGPSNGYKYLSDSNIDWGQDLRDLRRTMAELKIDRVYLSYFGLTDPSLYGIQSIPLDKKRERGIIAISVHHLNGISPFGPLPADLIQPLRQLKPIARAGDSILLFDQ